MSRLDELLKLRDEVMGLVREALDPEEGERRYSRGFVDAYAAEKVAQALRDQATKADEAAEAMWKEKTEIIADLQAQLRDAAEPPDTVGLRSVLAQALHDLEGIDNQVANACESIREAQRLLRERE